MSHFQDNDSQTFTRFMITSLFHQMVLWMEMINKTMVKGEFLRRLNEAKKANQLLMKEIEKDEAFIETISEAGEQFANINQYLMDYVKNKDTAGAFNLLAMVEIMAAGDLEEVEKLWQGLGVYIGQLRAKRLTEERSAA
ncbi:hypothetical protein [Siphonobacter sp. BAB-5385]|uniref:hypothetical protein n=1 Tax=Siphonobacter sp. BAB-5385 TaxID=1864822 RepID=UPI0011408FE3|nr:hypothetical protein [Siphonobacter sp. BAB-5385]